MPSLTVQMILESQRQYAAAWGIRLAAEVHECARGRLLDTRTSEALRRFLHSAVDLACLGSEIAASVLSSQTELRVSAMIVVSPFAPDQAAGLEACQGFARALGGRLEEGACRGRGTRQLILLLPLFELAFKSPSSPPVSRWTYF